MTIDEAKLRSFITGSRAYGIPKKGSDVDLVVLVSYETLELLKTLADRVVEVTEQQDYDKTMLMTGASLCFGRLNLIVVTDPDLFHIWRDGTEFLKTKKPVTREKAVQYLTKKRERIYKK